MAQNTTFNVSALGLGAGIYTTKIELGFGTVPTGFKGSSNLYGTTLEIDRNGALSLRRSSPVKTIQHGTRAC